MKYTDIPRLRRYLVYNIKTKPITVVFILSIMEIEAWFIAEHTHFTRIHPSLTLQQISIDTGIEPSNDDIERLTHPAHDLHRIYSLAGISYEKNKDVVQQTIDKLDYAYIYMALPNRFSDLQILIENIDSFLNIT